ncbi:uncharacterized protein LOC120309134 [Crotalus tigris]|uniref:uncharacterized protein LOC120309134 n=1 Tax=Crotalus tigris TaxID=88082 RepID=UPI00192F30EC|nr:uncharacterized protein LOC120309134 [Crotalus tigris]XP_039201967.1 uncharacterized protein LOC120309134 [Crotalus tigris]XP_039201968.1 uncharacterized protein LOC120309134 [Crotalus tigris]XP_039201969.1 uncharacterized protein LOC120309134 [Crotalus tigris]XP_039201970.1 uncharacterized protein LOC120309134 [Crotalus tigris]
MLTVLQNVISDCCHLLLFLLVAILFVPATIWAFKKVKKIQADARNKKQSKYRVPWIASLERLSVTSTDPERKKGISSATEQKSCNNLSLYRTLCVLDKKIEYLTWQMQRISKPISRSASNTTLDSITSLYSWAHSSTRDVCYSRSRTPPSPPVPIASQEIPEWQGHVTSPYKTGFQKSRQRSSSYPPMNFQLHQKSKQRRRSTPTSESLTKLTPRVPSRVRSSPIHIQRFGGRIYFLDYKEQELLDWHIHKKHWQKEAPPLPWQKETPQSHWEKEAPPLYWEKDAPPLHWQKEDPPLPWQKEAPPLYWQKETPPLPWQKEAPPLHWQKEAPPLYWQNEAPPLHWQKEAPPLHWQYWQKEAPPLYWQREAPPLQWQKEASPFSQMPSRDTNVQVGITPQNEVVQWVSQQVSIGQRSRGHTPPSTSPKAHHTPHKPPPVRVKSPKPHIQTPASSPKDLLPPPFIICQTTSHSNLKAPDNVQIGITPQNEVVHWVSQQRSIGQRSHSRTPPSTSPKGRQTSPKPPPVRVRSPGPHTQTPEPSPKDLLPPPFIICHTTSHSSLKAPRDVNLSSMTPKEELKEVLNLLAQNQSLLTKQPGRPRTPKKKEKEVRGKRPSTSKESAGRSGSPKDKPAETQISLMLDQKIHRLSWAKDMTEVPKESGDLRSPIRTSFLDPTFMCQNQLELPCVHKTQVELHQESLKLPKSPPKSQCLAHAIVESLDTEQATRDLHMCLAKGLENGRSRPSVEYPVCLLCGRCAPYCPHPHPQHGPCLLVYPRLSVQDGEVYMNLGFLLKIKRHEASKWGLVQGKDASKLQHSKEHPSKRERSPSRSRSRSRSRNAHEAAPPSWAPERPSHQARQRSTEAIDLRVRRHRAGSRPSRATPPRSSPRSPKMEPQSRIRKPAPEAIQSKFPQKPPSILKKLLLCIRKVWAKVRRKKELPSTKQSSRASLQKAASSQNLVVPSATSGFQAKGILHHKQNSLPKDAMTPTHLKQGHSHGRRKVSMKVSEPETFHSHKKVDSYRAKSASSGAPKKHSRHSPAMQLQRSPSKHPRDQMY